MSVKWSPETTKELKELFAAGHTMYQIALALSANHGKISRGAVISKCDREGLSRGNTKPHTHYPATQLEDKTWLYPETPTSVSFIELNARQCKWPVGFTTGAKMMCCGAPKESHRSYCEEHRAASKHEDQQPLKYEVTRT
jgi:hypothetical protein